MDKISMTEGKMTSLESLTSTTKIEKVHEVKSNIRRENTECWHVESSIKGL